MSNPTVIRLFGNHSKKYSAGSQAVQEARGRIEAETLADLSAKARARIEAYAARVLAQSRDDTAMELAAQIEANCGEEANPPVMVQTKLEAATLATAEAAEACVLAESLALRESEARLIAYREAEQAALDRAAVERAAAEISKQRKLLEDQARADAEACECAEHLAYEAALNRAKAREAARIEAKRKLKAEQDATELMLSQAEANRNAAQLQEQANVLLRKAVQKAQERLATETMASKAAVFRLQTERELAVLAEQRAEAELRLAREVELKLRAETKELAVTNERLAIAQQPIV